MYKESRCQIAATDVVADAVVTGISYTVLPQENLGKSHLAPLRVLV